MGILFLEDDVGRSREMCESRVDGCRFSGVLF
jgi:hypothetical protein